jgi:murein DD-endopeptidase MepM/ murein hydrolase activator NlpD
MSARPVSHALVLPDQNFAQWLDATRAYTAKFERIVVVRSPAGFNLNRFRNVSAVQAPSVWLNNDATAHIRRIYPMVVRVDVLATSTPAPLKALLDARAAANDRFGERTNQDGHLRDRFVLDFPVSAMGSRIVRPFNADIGRRHEGIDINAAQGTAVKACAGGRVVTVSRTSNNLGYGEFVQISTVFNGQTLLVTYAGLQSITTPVGSEVSLGQAFAQVGAAGTIKLVVQAPGRGQSGYALPDIVDPTPLIYWDGLRLRGVADGLRLREQPGTQFRVLTQVDTIDALEPLELHGRVLNKVGQSNLWVQVRAGNGVEGHAAGWLTTTYDLDENSWELGNPLGVNLDFMMARGRPAANRLRGLGWVRLAYNVSRGTGNQDLTAALNFHLPQLQQYAAAGYKIMLVLGHQTYGEGAGFVWEQMNDTRWRNEFTPRFVNVVRTIAGQLAGRGLVHCYQIWNEMDAPPQSVASVKMSPQAYGYLLGQTAAAIRAVDGAPRIITGGHTAGPANGPAYARAALTAAAQSGGLLPDGIATHPYGRGAPNTSTPYAPFGSIEEEIRAYAAIMPDRPVWLTEWGVLDRPQDTPQQIAQYANEIISFVRGRYSARVAALIWYAWAQGMHNGYGLVDANDQPRPPLHGLFVTG